MENNADGIEINNIEQRASNNHDSVDEIDSKNLDEADPTHGERFYILHLENFD